MRKSNREAGSTPLTVFWAVYRLVYYPGLPDGTVLRGYTTPNGDYSIHLITRYASNDYRIRQEEQYIFSRTEPYKKQPIFKWGEDYD